VVRDLKEWLVDGLVHEEKSGDSGKLGDDIEISEGGNQSYLVLEGNRSSCVPE
jgi:hypothetical protein